MFYNNLELLAAVFMGLGESAMHIMKEGGTQHSNTRYRGNIFTVFNITDNFDIPSVSWKEGNGGRGREFPTWPPVKLFC